MDDKRTTATVLRDAAGAYGLLAAVAGEQGKSALSKSYANLSRKAEARADYLEKLLAEAQVDSCGVMEENRYWAMCEMDNPPKPTPYQLWEHAKGDQGAYEALLVEHGYARVVAAPTPASAPAAAGTARKLCVKCGGSGKRKDGDPCKYCVWWPSTAAGTGEVVGYASLPDAKGAVRCLLCHSRAPGLEYCRCHEVSTRPTGYTCHDCHRLFGATPTPPPGEPTR